MAESSEFFVVRRSSTALSNRVIHDKELSFPALGLLMASLSLPPNAPSGYRAFLGRGMGEKAVRSALKELEEHDYRFRFRVRREGKIRDVTLVSDAPITVGEAQSEVVGMMTAGVVQRGKICGCLSHPETADSSAEDQEASPETVPEPVDNHRAADGAARSDSVDNSHTVPRSTVARWRTAHTSNEVSNNSSLRSELNTNQPAAKSDDRGVVGGVSEHSRGDPPDGVVADWNLLDECLPRPLRAGLSVSAGVRITRALEHALAAGWTKARVYRALNENPLPESMRNRTGLIIHRVQALADWSAPGVTDPRMPSPAKGGRGFEPPEEPMEPDWTLLARCLPEPMHGLDGEGAGWVMAWLTGLLGVGWTAPQVCASLGGNRLPDPIENLTGLVLHRLRKLSEIPAPKAKNKPVGNVAQPEMNVPPPSTEELVGTAQMWRTSTLGKPEFRARRLAEVLVRLVGRDEAFAGPARRELEGLSDLPASERESFVRRIENRVGVTGSVEGLRQ